MRGERKLGKLVGKNPSKQKMIRVAVLSVIAVVAAWKGWDLKSAGTSGSPELNRMKRTYRQAEKVVDTVSGAKKTAPKPTAKTPVAAKRQTSPKPAETGKTVKPAAAKTQTAPASNSPLFATFREKQIVTGSGTVRKVLMDDTAGIKHQRFILEDRNGDTVLVAHNIDLAQKIPSLKVGDTVDFCGEYVTNNQGGCIHWTHKDPARRHRAGWLRHNGRVYD